MKNRTGSTQSMKGSKDNVVKKDKERGKLLKQNKEPKEVTEMFYQKFNNLKMKLAKGMAKLYLKLLYIKMALLQVLIKIQTQTQVPKNLTQIIQIVKISNKMISNADL